MPGYTVSLAGVVIEPLVDDLAVFPFLDDSLLDVDFIALHVRPVHHVFVNSHVVTRRDRRNFEVPEFPDGIDELLFPFQVGSQSDRISVGGFGHDHIISVKFFHGVHDSPIPNEVEKFGKADILV